MIWLLVAVGGAAGSVLRYAVGRLAAHYLGADTVVGTFAVNIAGSFALGVLATIFITRSEWPLELRAMLTVGLLGGFTTFSTLAYDGVRLVSTGRTGSGRHFHRSQPGRWAGGRLRWRSGRSVAVLKSLVRGCGSFACRFERFLAGTFEC